jgi:Ca2+:H+ antiporter
MLVGRSMDKPFTFEFDLFAVIMLTLSVILASVVIYDGSSSYLLGVQLICVYLLLTVAYLLGAAK